MTDDAPAPASASLSDMLLEAARAAAARAARGEAGAAEEVHHLTLALVAAPPVDPPPESAQDAALGEWVGKAREAVSAHEWKLRELRDRFQNGGSATSARIAAEIDTHLEEHHVGSEPTQ